ncbi:MAG: HsdM family class I SAM-dependent methyltransferase [Planctomycetota bacterium]
MSGERSQSRTPAEPRDDSFVAQAAHLAKEYCDQTARSTRKKRGQFFTPPAVARFMAGLIEGTPERILDPAAGTGTLVCALVDRMREEGQRFPLHVDAYEIDAELIPLLKRALEKTSSAVPTFTFTIHHRDFVRDWLDGYGTLFSNDRPNYDVIIANPPYFKIHSRSRLARAAKSAHVPGRTNIYSLMMAVSASRLADGGEQIFIVPRSFCSGLYFKHFRRRLFESLSLRRVHVFESRRSAFRSDEVLQENIIVQLAKESDRGDVRVSASSGIADLPSVRPRQVPRETVISRDHTVRLPLSAADERVLGVADSWPNVLHSLGMEISTGPIVAYRSSSWISAGEGDYPLLLLNNVRQMAVEWPLRNGKPQFVENHTDARKWLVPNANYVLLRRFSAKEDTHRLLAAPYIEGQLQGAWLGLENHLNFVHRPHGSLTKAETVGLAALLNSDFLDAYFRIINGNTQVNATDLRALPLPPAHVITDVGEAVLSGARWEKVTPAVLKGHTPHFEFESADV